MHVNPFQANEHHSAAPKTLSIIIQCLNKCNIHSQIKVSSVKKVWETE